VLSCFDVINLGKFGVDRPVSVLDLGHGHGRIGIKPRLSMISAFVAWPPRSSIHYGHYRPIILSLIATGVARMTAIFSRQPLS
jgi:hypothetical protein